MLTYLGKTRRVVYVRCGSTEWCGRSSHLHIGVCLQASGASDIAVQFHKTIAARVLVWLAAVLVPVEAMPLTVCNCDSHSVQPVESHVGCSGAAPVAVCPNCVGESRTEPSCCGKSADQSSKNDRCDRTRVSGSCSCEGQCSHGASCDCAANHASPASNPISNQSPADGSKVSLSASPFAGGTTAAVVVPPSVLAGMGERPTSSIGSTAPERLSVLCRLVI